MIHKNTILTSLILKVLNSFIRYFSEDPFSSINFGSSSFDVVYLIVPNNGIFLTLPHLSAHFIAFNLGISCFLEVPFSLRIFRSVTVPCLAVSMVVSSIIVIVAWPLSGVEHEGTILKLCDLEVSLWSRVSFLASCVTLSIIFNEKVVLWPILSREHPVAILNSIQ